jgi:hypothetical protein
MKVSDFIKILKKLPQDLQVACRDDDGRTFYECDAHEYTLQQHQLWESLEHERPHRIVWIL